MKFLEISVSVEFLPQLKEKDGKYKEEKECKELTKDDKFGKTIKYMTKDMTGILVMGVENSNVRIYSKITFRICSKITLEFIPKIYL